MSKSILVKKPDGKFTFLRGTSDGDLRAQVTGSKAEVASTQETEVADVVETYTRAAGASEIGVYVESGSVRIRTDGDPATATTGVPLSEGFYEYFALASISVYYVEDSTITVVSR